MDPSIQMSLILLLGGLFVLILELFVPSGGLLFAIFCLCMLGSVFTAFMVSAHVGLSFLAVLIVLALILPWPLIEIWKRSWIGRRMTLESPLEPGEGANEEPPSAIEESTGNAFHRGSLIGQVGKTLTPLRPSGTTELLGRRVDTVAQGVMIERGELVKVIDVQGNKVVVQRLEPDEFDTDAFAFRPQ